MKPLRVFNEAQASLTPAALSVEPKEGIHPASEGWVSASPLQTQSESVTLMPFKRTLEALLATISLQTGRDRTPSHFVALEAFFGFAQN